MTWNVALSLVIFGVSLYFLLSEKLNRTIVAMAGAVAMIVIGLLLKFLRRSRSFTIYRF